MKLRTLFALAAAAIAATLSACGDREHTITAPPPGPVVLAMQALGPTWIGLTWQTPSGVDASGGTRVFRDGSLIGMSMDGEFVDRPLKPVTQYSYRVTTIDAEGHESGLSNAITLTTSHAPTILLAVSPSAASMEIGDTFRLTSTVRDSASGQAESGHTVTWTSANTAVATVANDGTVTAIAVGNVVITATTEGITATAAVSVKPKSAASVVVSPGQSSIQSTKTATLTAIARDAAGTVLTGKTFTWASSDPSVATVSPAGVVTGVGAGAVTISATTDGITGHASVGVVAGGGSTDPDVASLTVNPGAISIDVGVVAQVVATTRDGSGNVLTNKPIAWSTSDAAIATVSQSGAVTAVASGTVAITAASGGLEASATITVLTSNNGGGTVPVATVTVSPGTSTIATGATVQLSATTRDANGNTLNGRAVTWSSSNTSVATVSSSGLVTAVSAGAAVVSATSEGVSGSATVTVTAPPPTPVATISISPSSVSMAIGKTSQLTATTKDAQGATLAGRVVTWSSSDPAVATVSASGVVSGVAVGAAVITATSEGISASITATITPKPVVTVTITGTGPVCVGASLQLAAIPKDIDGNPLTGRAVVWTTSTGALATISPTGLVLGVAIGSVTITATVEGVSTSVTLGVCAPIVATVSISSPQGTLSILSGLLMQLTATAKDANGNVILGRPVTWTVSPALKALISVNGLLTPLSLGSVTVTATIDGVSASTSISILP